MALSWLSRNVWAHDLFEYQQQIARLKMAKRMGGVAAAADAEIARLQGLIDGLQATYLGTTPLESPRGDEGHLFPGDGGYPG